MSTFNTYKYFNNRRLVENNEMMEEDILNPIIKFDISEKLYKILKVICDTIGIDLFEKGSSYYK
jgi:hypothetical protein